MTTNTSPSKMHICRLIYKRLMKEGFNSSVFKTGRLEFLHEAKIQCDFVEVTAKTYYRLIHVENEKPTLLPSSIVGVDILAFSIDELVAALKNKLHATTIKVNVTY